MLEVGDCLSGERLLVSSQCVSKPRGGCELNLGQGGQGGGGDLCGSLSPTLAVSPKVR